MRASRRSRRSKGFTGLLAVPLMLAGGATTAEAHPDRNALVVRTDDGRVRGTVADAVENFRGIPYAAAPTGELRWRSPQPVSSWKGVRPAETFGNACPQGESIDSPRIEDEDCLFVNVQRPVGTTSDAELPVYVYLHGGGFVGGSGNNENPNRIVEQTGVVAVTVNYRLGVLGFLAEPSLTQEAAESGNYGLQDQQAALRWVHDNIDAFGGDPGRVTIGGESAGGWSVCSHLVSPGSRGLFSQAMMQSGACPSQSPEEAETAGSDFAAAVGCVGDDVLACLRRQPAATLLDTPGVPARPVRDTTFLPVDPREQVAAGRFAHVPVVIGATRDEGRAFSQDSIGWTREEYENSVRGTWGEQGDAVLARYPWPADADEFTAAYLIGAVITDAGTLGGAVGQGIGGCADRALSREIAEHVPTWRYEWAARGGVAWYEVPGYDWGAGHATELPYLFPDRNAGANAALFTDQAQDLADELKARWGAFVRSGSPQAGTVEWPQYEGEDGSTLSFRLGSTSPLTAEEYAAEHQCDFWDEVAGSTGT